MGRNSRCARLWTSEMEIGDTVAGVGTEDISVADWLAELSQKPKPIAATPAATTTPISVRIFETLLHRAQNELLNFCVEKKGNTPDPSQLLRGQDPAQYLIIILMEIIKNLYTRPVSDRLRISGGIEAARV